jgi:hypothetical protein
MYVGLQKLFDRLGNLQNGTLKKLTRYRYSSTRFAESGRQV